MCPRDACLLAPSPTPPSGMDAPGLPAISGASEHMQWGHVRPPGLQGSRRPAFHARLCNLSFSGGFWSRQCFREVVGWSRLSSGLQQTHVSILALPTPQPVTLGTSDLNPLPLLTCKQGSRCGEDSCTDLGRLCAEGLGHARSPTPLTAHSQDPRAPLVFLPAVSPRPESRGAGAGGA